MAATSQNLPDGLHTRALNNGNVEFTFVGEGKVILSGQITPDQVSVVVTNFLNSAHNAFHNADKKIDETSVIHFQGDGIQVMRWGVGPTGQPNQQSLIIQIGDSKIAFIVPQERLRALAAYLIEASRTTHPQPPPLELLRATRRELTAGLRGFAFSAKVYFKNWLRRNAISIRSKVSGHAFRVFRTIDLTQKADVPEYDPVGKCIYCDAPFYSTKAGIRTSPFGAEHIIPEGIGGTLELPEASCQTCEDTTGRLVEGDALGRTLKALRVFLNLKKAGKGPHPKILPLEVADQPGGGRRIIPDVPIDIYPITFMLPVDHPPEFLPIATEYGKALRAATVANLRIDLKALYRRYGVVSFATAAWDNAMLCRMLAKIGHSLAVAEMGGGCFRPFLKEFISKGDVACMSLVGCSPGHEKIRASAALHALSLGYQRYRSRTYVVASIRLFAQYGTPVYRIVVGESLETLLARAKRVYAYRILRMLGR